MCYLSERSADIPIFAIWSIILIMTMIMTDFIVYETPVVCKNDRPYGVIDIRVTLFCISLHIL